ncbi:uncharacterized protein LOC111046768 isoform X2 [Nilaparvata lugens]|uniref:uncharacterized protein LOC111046768 isoform X2 n=1 Tax=Nilaparvata lugens TaxID=108931 RepID=UPI00193CFAA3|nr:uncharacterized protein LOC111046768 isoform X2 [Nilaparvata lugens]
MAVTNGLKVKLVKVFDSKLTNISSLLWCNIDSLSGVLIVGNIRGLINSVCVKFCDMLKNDEEDVRNDEENVENDEENVGNDEENVGNDEENVGNDEGLGGEVRNDEGNVKNSEVLGGEVRNDEGIVKNDGENVRNDEENVKYTEGLGGEVRNDEGNVKNSEGLGGEVRNDEGIVKNDGENVKNDGENVKNSEGLGKEVRDDEVCGENREIVSSVQEVEEVVQKSKAQTEKFSGKTTESVEKNVQLVNICEETTQPVIEDPSKNQNLASKKVPNLTPEQDANVSSEQGPNLTSVSNPNQTQQPNLTCVSNSKDTQQPIATSVSNPKQTQQPNATPVSNPKETQQPNPTPVSNPNQTQQPNLTCVSNPKETQQPNPTPVSNPNQTQQPNLTYVSNPKVTQKPNLTPVSNTNLTSKSNPPGGNVEISVEPLWRDEDLLSISSLICWDVDDVNVCAVCIKDMYIIVLIVQKNSGKLVSTHIHNTNRRNLAGLLKLDNASFLIGSQQGALFKLTLVQDDNGQLKFMNETVQNNFIRSRYGVMGLAASRNRDFVAVNLCVNGPYDHSKLKTLSSLVICSLENREIDLMTMISSNSFVNLDRIWDCLENVRLSILQKSLTYIFPSTIRCQLDTMDIHPLILTMWLTNFVAYSLQLEQMEVGIELLLLPENKSQTMTRLYEEIRLLVFSSHIFQRCTLILSSSSSSSSSSFSLLSLRLMRKWICSGLLLNSSMDCHSTTRLTATSIVEQIDVHLRSKVGEGDCGQQAGERETCIVCGNDIVSLSDFSVATCTEGHQIRRCTLSLVQIPCDYDEVLQCKRCGVLAHPQAGDYASCVFCNSLLAPDQELIPDSQILVLEDEHDNIGQNRRRPRTRSIEMRGERGEESDSDDELVVPKKKSKKKAK